ncbi:MAG TPA: serine/threonine-protein kinase [Holophagaceae bacterium]|nr:serine/threonine-protein kinase [Holophagaceae bacterium]
MLTKLGKFEIIRLLGQGSMGEVYLGRDPLIGREVAIKVIHAASTLGKDARDRFAREARAAGVLNHPNIVTIHELGEDQGVLYLAMEHVKGEDLASLLREGNLSAREVVEVLAQVCDGLAVAHRQHILHRDIKPSNIKVVWDGTVLQAKILDFGVAKHINSDTTDEGTVFGTVNYMAPEYLQSGRPDARSDLFAVGVVLYEALAGAPPFDGPSPGAIIYRLLHEAPQQLPKEVMQGLSPDLQSVLNRTLAKDPGNRFQTAEDLAKALRGTLDPNWHFDKEQATVALQMPRKGGSLAPGKPVTPRTPPKGIAPERFRPSALVVPPPAALPVPHPPATPAISAPLVPPPLLQPAKREGIKSPSHPLKRAMPTQKEPSLEVQMDLLLETRRQVMQALELDPRNPRAHALLMVTLYRMRQVEHFTTAMRSAQAMNVQVRDLKAVPRFRQLVDEEHRACLLPFELHAEFMSWAGG